MVSRWWRRLVPTKSQPEYPLMDERDAGMHQHQAGLSFEDMGIEPEPEYLYVEFPDGTTRRCAVTRDPVYGFPVTPGLNSPEWKVVDQ